MRKHPRQREIDVLDWPTRDEFHARLQGEGRPAIVRGAIEHWRARKWTWADLEELFGNDEIEAISSIFGGSATIVRGTARDFLRWVQRDQPGGAPPEGRLTGRWPPRLSLYWASSLGALGEKGRRIISEIELEFPFVENLLAALEPPYDELVFYLPFANLFIGPSGTRVPPHRDYWGSHTFIFQLIGAKHVYLFAPSDKEHLHNVLAQIVDPRNPGAGFPAYEHATPYTGIMQPGDMLFIPSNWYHDVLSLSASVSLSWNFFTSENAAAYLSGLLRNIGLVTAALAQLPGIDYRSATTEQDPPRAGEPDIADWTAFGHIVIDEADQHEDAMCFLAPRTLRRPAEMLLIEHDDRGGFDVSNREITIEVREPKLQPLLAWIVQQEHFTLEDAVRNARDVHPGHVALVLSELLECNILALHGPPDRRSG